MFSIKTSLTYLLISASLIVGCSSDSEIIPDVSFSSRIYINDPLYSDNPFIVTRDGNNEIVGNAGVLVYRASNSEYYAFDLMCTHEKSRSSLVEITDGATCTCPDCGSVYIIVTASSSIAKGPAKWPLKSYQCSVNGDYLYIYN
jgi:nitrite reductase/ring-hydroxylating ferredoxin subunit